MNTKHTKGWWAIGPRGRIEMMPEGDRAPSRVIIVMENSIGRPSDARRIVACVNACEGIADPACVPQLLAACVAGEEALGENVQWLADALDLAVRQKDAETLRRLAQLNAAWEKIARAIARAVQS